MGMGAQNVVIKQPYAVQVLQSNGCAVLHLLLLQFLAADCSMQLHNRQSENRNKVG